MILEEFALLASDTARSKAYLQSMIHEEKYPKVCVVYSDDIAEMQKEACGYQENSKRQKYFDIDIPILYSLKQAGIAYLLVETKDINSPQMEEVIKKLEQKYLIYSGYGGYILKPHLFQMNKKYIHMHAGILPRYRGSTTAYYSYLQEGIFGAAAIFLNEKIDEGEIITQDTFGIPEQDVNIDYIYEPYIRSRVLAEVLEKYLREGGLTSEGQGQNRAETYYIIHPVLKHIALMGIENSRHNISGISESNAGREI